MTLKTNKKNQLVSVIIPTYNRGKPLCDTLESLFKQDYDNYEIIVVDQSIKKFPEKESFLKKYQNRFRYFTLSTPSLPGARNFGIKKAKGKIVLFVDDDIVARKNLISGHISSYEDSGVAAVAGRVVTFGQKVEPDFQGVGKISFWGMVAGGYSSKIRQEIGNLIGCNMSFRKAILEKVGGFDENFVGNALREETDVALRIKKFGWKIVFEPKAELTHIFYSTGACRKSEGRLKWYHDFFHNETYFFLKWVKWHWFLFFWLTRWQWFVRCMFGFGREVSWRSIKTPWLGIYDGFKTCRRKNENWG